jgi:hypothetical protein
LIAKKSAGLTLNQLQSNMKNTLRDPKLLADQLRMAISNVVYGTTPSVPPLTREFMSDSLTAFVLAAIDKFEKGQKEHGGDLRDRNHNKEILNEILDIFWYREASSWPKDTSGKIQEVMSRQHHID